MENSRSSLTCRTGECKFANSPKFGRVSLNLFLIRAALRSAKFTSLKGIRRRTLARKAAKSCNTFNPAMGLKLWQTCHKIAEKSSEIVPLGHHPFWKSRWKLKVENAWQLDSIERPERAICLDCYLPVSAPTPTPRTKKKMKFANASNHNRKPPHNFQVFASDGIPHDLAGEPWQKSPRHYPSLYNLRPD